MEAVAGSKRRADEAGLPRDADRSTKVSRVEGVSPTEADEGAGDNSHIPKDVALLLDEVAKERATLESSECVLCSACVVVYTCAPRLHGPWILPLQFVVPAVVAAGSHLPHVSPAGSLSSTRVCACLCE